MKNPKRLPKKEYFQKRLAQAIKNGNTKKAEYFISRLKEMGEPLTETKGQCGLVRHDFGNGLIFYTK